MLLKVEVVAPSCKDGQKESLQCTTTRHGHALDGTFDWLRHAPRVTFYGTI